MYVTRAMTVKITMCSREKVWSI